MIIQTSDSCTPSRWDKLKAKLNNLSRTEFEKKIAVTENAVLLDVRKADEINEKPFGEIKHIDYLSYTLADELEKLNPEQHYFVYCFTGRRSARVCVILNNLGFKHVYNLENGL